MSSKRAKGLSEYAKLRKKFLAEHPHCTVTLYISGYRRPATEVHHAKGRANGFLNDTRFWLPVCHDAHLSIEHSPKWALEHGFQFEKGHTIHDAAHAAKCLEHQERARKL